MKKYLPNKLVGSLMAVVAVLTLISLYGGDNGHTDLSQEINLQSAPAATDQPLRPSENFLTEVARGRDFYTSALRELTQGDPNGERLSAWHDSHVTYAAVLPGTAELFGVPVTTPVTQPGIVIAMVSPEELRALGAEFVSPWQYAPQNRRMHVLPPGQFTSVWAAAILAHELTHAMEYDAGVLPLGRMADDTHQDGEIRAYNVEIRLLDRATEGALSRFVDQMIDARRIEETPRDPVSDRIQPTLDEVRAFSGLFEPSASDEEELTRIVVLQQAANYRLADRYRLGETWKRRYNLFLEELIAERMNQPERLTR